MKKEERDFMVGEIDKLAEAVSQIKQLIASGELSKWSNALHLANLHELSGFESELKTQIVTCMFEILGPIDLEMSLYDLAGEFYEPFPVLYKGEKVAYFRPDSTIIKVLDRKAQITFYNTMDKLTNKDWKEKIQTLEESASSVQLFSEQMSKLGYQILSA